MQLKWRKADLRQKYRHSWFALTPQPNELFACKRYSISSKATVTWRWTTKCYVTPPCYHSSTQHFRASLARSLTLSPRTRSSWHYHNPQSFAHRSLCPQSDYSRESNISPKQQRQHRPGGGRSGLLASSVHGQRGRRRGSHVGRTPLWYPCSFMSMKLISGQRNDAALRRGFKCKRPSEGELVLCYHSELKTENYNLFHLVCLVQHCGPNGG